MDPSSSPLASATEDEIIVSQILLDLRILMSLSESLSDFNWGRRRRRSFLGPRQPPPPLIAAPPRPAASRENIIEETRALTKPEDAAVLDDKHGGGAHTTAASPNTPLSFSPSEPDEKPKHSSKKSSKKRSREKYLDMIDGLTQRKELLAGEVENVRKYYNKLKALNSKLKAMKQKSLNSGINPDMELAQRIPEPDQQPLDCQHTPGPIAAHVQPSDDGLGLINKRGPLGIDLNLPAEEAFDVELYQPLDVTREIIIDKRARFAEARRKRIGIMKAKSSRNFALNSKKS